RGISGSGKTVVALHRARRLAAAAKGGEWVLFTTFNKALSKAAGLLLDSFCGAERQRIEVTHLDRWCLDLVSFAGVAKPQWSPDQKDKTRVSTWASLGPESRTVLHDLPRDYIWNEIEF